MKKNKDIELVKLQRHLSDFTIDEFEKFQEYIADADEYINEIFELFGISLMDVDMPHMLKLLNEIVDQQPENKIKGVKEKYILNGMTYDLTFDGTKMTAQQFIDYRNAVDSKKMDEIVSCLLIPRKLLKSNVIQEKNIFDKIGDKLHIKKDKYVKQKYGDDYNIDEVKENINKYMRIGDIFEIAGFFLYQSTVLSSHLVEYSQKMKTKMEMEMINQRK